MKPFSGLHLCFFLASTQPVFLQHIRYKWGILLMIVIKGLLGILIYIIIIRERFWSDSHSISDEQASIIMDFCLDYIIIAMGNILSLHRAERSLRAMFKLQCAQQSALIHVINRHLHRVHLPIDATLRMSRHASRELCFEIQQQMEWLL